MTFRAPPLWDLPTRLLHWGLAASVGTALATALVAPPEAMTLHVWSGATAVALVAARAVWGLVGGEHSRFAAFPLSPGALKAHARHVVAALRGRAEAAPWPGHPPLGALMAVLLLAGVAGLGVTGAIALGGQEAAGPLAGRVGFELGHALAEAHEVLGLALLALVAGHLLGVAVESRLMREALVRSMITGRRRLETPVRRMARPLAGTLGALSLVGGGAAGALALSETAPDPFAARPAPAAYAKECGACHMAYPAALLPADSWRAMMGDLSNHFGEDAWLPPETVATLTGWLTANAAETWDSKAGHAFRRAGAEAPLRVTGTPFWRRRHDDLPEALFRSAAVRSPANCKACHADAPSGAFRRAAIDVPD